MISREYSPDPTDPGNNNTDIDFYSRPGGLKVLLLIGIAITSFGMAIAGLTSLQLLSASGCMALLSVWMHFPDFSHPRHDSHGGPISDEPESPLPDRFALLTIGPMCLIGAGYFALLGD